MLQEAQGELEAARASAAGRSAKTLFHGEVLSQVVMGLTEGTQLAEHQNPGEGTLQTLVGEVRLDSGEQSWTVPEGQWVVIPQALHSVTALSDSAVLLTVARS